MTSSPSSQPSTQPSSQPNGRRRPRRRTVVALIVVALVAAVALGLLAVWVVFFSSPAPAAPSLDDALKVLLPSPSAG